MSDTGRSRRYSRHRRDSRRDNSHRPSPPGSDDEYYSDPDSLASRDPPPRRHSRRDSKALVVRDPYQLQAPPRAHRRDESVDEEYEYTIPRDFDEAARERRREERARRQKKEGMTLVAVALFAASVVFCMDWCSSSDD